MLLIPLTNHIIRQNPETQHALCGHAGRSFAVEAAGFALSARIGGSGLLEHHNGTPECRIFFSAQAVQNIMRGLPPGVGGIRIEGDDALAVALLPLIGSLRYHANDDLGKIFGDAAAARITADSANIRRAAKTLAASVMEQISDFSKEPESLLTDDAAFQKQAEEIGRLRDDIARLEARLNKLEQTLRHNA